MNSLRKLVQQTLAEVIQNPPVTYLFHGTSDAHLDKIMSQGLQNPYLTDSFNKAEYYSEVASEEDGGAPIILKVKIPSSSNLRVDFPELDEPVSPDGDYEHARKRVHDAYKKYIRKYPKSLDKKHDIINVDKHHYWVSLNSTDTVQYEGIIPTENISIADISDSHLEEGHYTTWKTLEEAPIDAFQGQETEIVHKLAKHFKIGKIAPLGNGTSGFAYYIPNNRVLKITRDKSEVSEAKKIQGKKLKHLANIYGTYSLGGKYEGTYVIISELLLKDEDMDSAEILLEEFFEKNFQYDLSWFFEDYSNGSVTKDEIKEYTAQLREYYYHDDHKLRLALWYMNGMLGVIDDIRRNNILSTDWVASNLGVKKNGNIAMYDLGYGDPDVPQTVQNIHLNEGMGYPAMDYPDFFDGQANPLFNARPYPPAMNLNNAPLSEEMLEEKKRISDNTIQYLLNKMKIFDARYLKSGGYGDAYEADGKIIKFTKDFKEAKLAQKFSRHHFKHVANIEKVVRYDEGKNDWVYIITLEKLTPITEEDQKIFRTYEKAIAAYNHFKHETGTRHSFEDVLKHIDAEYLQEYFDPWVRRDIKLHLNQVIDTAKQVEQLKKEVSQVMPSDQVEDSLSDFSVWNMGKKPDGTLAFFDLRWEFTQLPTDVHTIKETEISSEEVNKRELPFRFPQLFDDFVTEKTEAEVREVAPTINLNHNPAEIVSDMQKNYPSLFDDFADWIFNRQQNVTTLSETREKRKDISLKQAIMLSSIEDVDAVAQWLKKPIDKISFSFSMEPMSMFLDQALHMEATYNTFPQDEARTKKIYDALKGGKKKRPIFVQSDSDDKFIMEGRHRIVAFKWLGLKQIPVIFVS